MAGDHRTALAALKITWQLAVWFHRTFKDSAFNPFVGADGQTTAWKIEFDPDSPECEIWNDVFQVRERIKRDVLDPSFDRWLHDFAAWFKQRKDLENLGDDLVKEGMLEYAKIWR